jgi:hypothetical protein
LALGELARLEAEAATPGLGSTAYMIPCFAREYRALVTDLAHTLQGVTVARTRAELRKVVGEFRVETTDEAIELWSTQTAEQVPMRIASGSQQQILVAGARYQRYLALATALDIAPHTGRQLPP